MVKKAYDIVIAGCGIAGAVAALSALKKNVSVCIVEKKEREFIGKKLCGELMPIETLEWLSHEFRFSVERYPLKGLEICSSSGHKSHVAEPLCTVDRWQFGQALVEKLLDKGAEVSHGTAVSPVVESSVKGVNTKNGTFHSTVAIDCSGVSSILRRKVPILSDEPQLLGLAYKENLVLKEPVAIEYAMLMFDKKVIPSGYAWCFPKNEYTLNVGAGGLVCSQASLQKKLHKIVDILGFKIKKREHTGVGILPLGRPLPSAVYPGLLVCGDAAHQVNPLTGEGIAPAVKAGYAAGTIAAEAVQTSDVSCEGMWKYNIDVARGYGMRHASLVAARDFLVSLSDEELGYILENVATGADLGQLIKGRTSFTGMRKAQILIHNWRKSALLYRLYRVFKRMNEIKRLYEHYPETPAEFSSWLHMLDSFFSKEK